MIKTQLVTIYINAKLISYFSLLNFSELDDSVIQIAEFIQSSNPAVVGRFRKGKRPRETFELVCSRAWGVTNYYQEKKFLPIFRDLMLKKFNMKISSIKLIPDDGVIRVRFNITPSVKIHNHASF